MSRRWMNYRMRCERGALKVKGGGDAMPANALMLNGKYLMLNDQYLVLNQGA